jgi:hypothetical protein
MRDSKGRFLPERQRRFDRALREIERHCSGPVGRLHGVGEAPRIEIEPGEVERVRWLVIAMSVARGTPGSLVIGALARRGYAIITAAGPFRTPPDVVALDTPGLIRSGKVLPSWCQPWKRMGSCPSGWCRRPRAEPLA